MILFNYSRISHTQTLVPRFPLPHFQLAAGAEMHEQAEKFKEIGCGHRI